jgi:PAS domain S-box-containing protein
MSALSTRSIVGFRRHRGAVAVGLFVAYCAVAVGGLHFAAVHRNVSPVWPASAVALAGLLLCGISYWFVVFVAGTVVSLWTGAPWWAAPIAGAGVTLQAVVGAVALRHVGFRTRVGTLGDLLKLWLVAGVAAATISPTIGVAALTAAGLIPRDQIGWAWSIWYLGDTAGIVLVTPLFLTLLARRWPRPAPWRFVEGAAMLAATVVVAEIAFDPASGYPFLPFVVLFLVAVRFDLRLTAVAVATVSFVAIWETAHGRSQFIGSSQHESLLQLYRFILVLGSVSLVLAALFDEQRRIVEALRSSEARFRLVFQASPLPKMIYDRVSAAFLDVNDAWKRTFGWKRDEVIGSDIDGLGLWPAENRNDVAKALDEGSVVVRDTRLHARGGIARHGLLSAKVIRVDGDEQVVATFQDLTEYKKLEEQLRQAQKMEAVGQVTSGVAHDFNNVLAVILANAQLGKAEATDREQLGKMLDEITSAARRGGAIVRQLLSLSRRADFKFTPTDLNESVRSAAGMLRRLIPEDIEMQLAIEDPPNVALVDDASVDQALLNLATNARDAMPEGGTLRIEVGTTRLSERDCQAIPWLSAGDYVVVSMADTGVGMDEETRNRVFEPFFTTKSAERGTGLGMAMVQSLLRQHGGLAKVESSPGHGTAVSLYFPALEAATTTLEGTQGKGAVKGGDETILLVEDDDAVADVARRVLEKHGYTVLLASNGREGLDLYRANASGVDLVISDVIMPRMSGVELSAAIQKGPNAPGFLLWSGYSHGVSAKTPRTATPFMPKPWDVDDLLRTVREVLDARGEDAADQSSTGG